jgi:hypothetical protein
LEGERVSRNPLRALSNKRTWNIALRTVHIAVTGVLFGGHAFGIERERLWPWFYLTILSGVALILIEAYPNWRWCCQGRGVMVLTKVLLACTVFWLWDYRVPILAVVIIIGSAGSHMPSRFRYYLLLAGPGGSPGTRSGLANF